MDMPMISPAWPSSSGRDQALRIGAQAAQSRRRQAARIVGTRLRGADAPRGADAIEPRNRRRSARHARAMAARPPGAAG